MMTLQDIFARIFRPVGPRKPFSPAAAKLYQDTHNQAPIWRGPVRLKKK